MNKKIYFAGSIRGGRVDAALYQQIIEHIKQDAPQLELLDAPTFFELYRRWLKENPDAANGKIE